MRKDKFIAVSLALLLILAPALQGSESDSNQASSKDRIEVRFGQPESFRDLVGVPSNEIELLFKEIRRAFNQYADWALPEDYSMEIEVEDIDFPGWMDSSEIDLPKERLFFEMYPPRIGFHYTVRNSNGETIYEGYQRLVEYDYLNFLVTDSHPTEYFKNMIASWSFDKLKNVIIFAAS